ncbi:MAG: DUF1622 domain-containing protein [Clostridiaceae bacterium]
MGEFIDHYLPYIIYMLEIMGIIIIIATSISAFIIYIKGILGGKIQDELIKMDFAKGLGMSLEFLLSAEVLKTIIVHTTDELIVLGVIMGLRIIVTFLPHWMHDTDKSHKKLPDKLDKAS